MAFIGQLPSLPHRLAKLYSDSKHSADVVTERDTVEDAPELISLHRKFRIQKDRYIAWGLEWSDDSKGSIDESVGRAGLTETVASVMRTIKEIYNEAEQLLQHSPSGTTGEKTRPLDAGTKRWNDTDRARFEDLYKDLEKSIDVLYELSRARRALQAGSYSYPTTESPEKSGILPPTKSIFLAPDYSASAETLVGSTRVSTSKTLPGLELPPKLDYSSLILTGEDPPPYHAVSGTSPASRIIARLRVAAPTKPWRISTRQITIPVLIEYAPFDAAYRQTGVPPPSERLDSYLNFLARAKTLYGKEEYNCRGWFEDPVHPQIGLVYDLPQFVEAHSRVATQSLETFKPASLLQLLQSQHGLKVVPPLELRFQLAREVVSAIGKIHEDGLVHKNLNSGNILLFKDSSRDKRTTMSGYNGYAPFIGAYDVYSEFSLDPIQNASHPSVYRHPSDPFVAGGMQKKYHWQYDLYTLGLILLEIGMWTPIADLFKPKYTLEDFKVRAINLWTRNRLGGKCGTLYMRVVEDCLLAADQLATTAPDFPRQTYDRILGKLSRCCLIDEVESTTTSFASTLIATPPSSQTILPRSSSEPALASTPSRRASTGSETLLQSDTSPLPDLRLISQPLALKYLTPKTSLHPLTEGDEPPLSKTESRPSSIYRRRVSGASPRDDSDNTSTYSVASQYKAAAKIIQRAWRARSNKMVFSECKDKVKIAQRKWREKYERKATSIRKRSYDHGPSEASPAMVTRFAGAYGSAAAASFVQADLSGQAPSSTPSGKPTPPSSTHTLSYTDVPATRLMDPAKRKVFIYPLKFTQTQTDEWHNVLMPRLKRLLDRALKDSLESCSVDLISVGETQATARPTIFVTCGSTARVKAVLSRKFDYDRAVFDLIVKKGKVRRSKVNRSRAADEKQNRSMWYPEGSQYPVANPRKYSRPLCGSSIGAYIYDKNKNLPPVSYGGAIVVDGEAFGMTVHHCVDPPSDIEDSDLEYSDDEEEHDDDQDSRSGYGESDTDLDATRSSARHHEQLSMLAGMGSLHTPFDDEEGIPMELSEDEADNENISDELFSDFDSDTDEGFDGDDATQGDVDGIKPGCGENITITHPALDDVELVSPGYYPVRRDRHDEHESIHKIGHVYASSGRKRWNRNDEVHEVDWALLQMRDGKFQPYNLVQGGKRYHVTNSDFCPNLLNPVDRHLGFSADWDEYPTSIVPERKLGDLRVHCVGRTSGLQGGMLSKVKSLVKIAGRRSFSHTWKIEGAKFGMGGDSGAWIIDNDTGGVCGHVLAFSDRDKIAYLCPMEVLIEDIKRTLGAREVCLPGGQGVAESMGACDSLVASMEESMAGLSLPPVRSRSPMLAVGALSPCVDKVTAA